MYKSLRTAVVVFGIYVAGNNETTKLVGSFCRNVTPHEDCELMKLKLSIPFSQK